MQHGQIVTKNKQRYVYLNGEGLKHSSVLSPQEKRAYGLTKSRSFVSQKERLKSSRLSAYQALVGGAE